MKTIQFASIIVGFSLAACAGAAPDDSQPAAFAQEDLLLASSRTTDASGITTWELTRDGAGSRVIGRNFGNEILADVTTSNDPHGCPAGGGSLVTTTAALPTRGVRSAGCGGQIQSDSMDAKTRQVVDLLFADLESASPAVAPTPEPKALNPYAPGGAPFPTTSPYTPLNSCVPHTNTKCTVAVYWCKETFINCSTNTWHPCGTCFGWKW